MKRINKTQRNWRFWDHSPRKWLWFEKDLRLALERAVCLAIHSISRLILTLERLGGIFIVSRTVSDGLSFFGDIHVMCYGLAMLWARQGLIRATRGLDCWENKPWIWRHGLNMNSLTILFLMPSDAMMAKFGFLQFTRLLTVTQLPRLALHFHR